MRNFLLITGLAVLVAGTSCAKKNDRVAYVEKRAKIRAYEGAPPVIPHTIVKGETKYCLSCHEKGIVFEKDAELMGVKSAVAKITPHPTWVNCFQCHVPQQDVKVFHKNTFKTFRLAHVANPEKTGEEPAPPMMPHQMENRESCTVCHFSKTADPSITPKHGMREGCEFCHQPPESLNIYPGEDE